MRHSLAHRCDSLVGHVYKVCRQKLDSSASFRPIRSVSSNRREEDFILTQASKMAGVSGGLVR